MPSKFVMRSLGRFLLGMAMIATLLCSCSRKSVAFNEQLRSDIERHENLVLSTEEKYKTGALHADGETLDTTVDFFDSLVQCYPKDDELRFLLAKSYYYLGTENTSARHDVEAATHYVAALKTAWACQHDKGAELTRFKGLCHYRLGEILYNYTIQTSAIHAFDSAQCYFAQVQDTLGVAACIRSVGEVYLSGKGYECALIKFKEANRLWDFGDALYDHSIGGLFFENHQIDSARRYLERSFETGGIYTRIDAAAKLAEIWRELDNHEKEDYYTLFYVQNTIRETNRSFDKMEIEVIYDDIRRMADAQASRPAPTRHIPVIVAVAIVVIALMAYIIFRNRHRISHIEQQLSVMEKSHREESEDKEQQLQTVTQELDATKQRLERRRQAPSIDFESALDRYLNAPVSIKIRKSVEGKDIMTKSVSLYQKLKLSEMDFIELVHAANNSFPDFSVYLLHDFEALSTSDVRHCCLALMGLNDVEIAVLEGITYSGSNRRTKRILSFLDHGSGLEEAVLVYLKNLYK